MIIGDRLENSPPAPVAENRELPSSPSILHILSESLAEELFMEATEIDEEAKFVDIGMDSITAVTWMRKINQLFGSSLPATDVYKYPTLSDFTCNIEQTVARIQSNKGAVAVSPQTVSDQIPKQSPPTPANSQFAVGRNSDSNNAIAVIGMAGRFPRAKNLEEFWENIAKGRNCVSEIASDRNIAL